MGSSGSPAFLLSGSDKKVHLYKQQERLFVETEVVELFPELTSIPSVALSFEALPLKPKKVVATGCQSGEVAVSITGA